MKIWKYILTAAGLVGAALGVSAIINKPKSIYMNKPEEKNPFEGKKVRFVRDANDTVNEDGE